MSIVQKLSCRRTAQYVHPRVHRLEDRLAPSAGMVDPTFGVGGRATLAFPSPSDDAGRAVAIDNLGRIVVAGRTNHQLAVPRYTASGSLDLTFGSGGKFVQRLYNGNAVGEANTSGVAVDSFNRIVISWAENGGFTIARLTAAGEFDSTFDGDGHATLSFGGYNETANAVAIDSQGRVIVAGGSYQNGNADFAVARLTAAGELDPSFDGDGKVTIDFGFNFDTAYGVAIDSSDRIVLAGYSNPSGSNGHFALARLTTAGTLDPTFDSDGRATVSFGSVDAASAVAIDSLGRIIAVGNAESGPAVARLTAAGDLDSDFDGDGKATFNFGFQNERLHSVAIDSLSRVIVAGAAYTGSNLDFALARLTSAGALDPTFDGDGRVTVSFGSRSSEAFGVAVDTQDRIVVSGDSYAPVGFQTLSRFATARLSTSGALDSTFDGDGRVLTEFMTGTANLNGVAVDSQGRTIIVGSSSQFPAYFAVARFTPAGALDPSFDGDGILTLNTTYATAVAVDSLDRIIVARAGSGIFTVMRLTVSGALDMSFDGDGEASVIFPGNTFNNPATLHGLAVDSQNRVILAGDWNNGANTDVAVARLTDAGVLDNSFNGSGKITISVTSGSDTANAVSVDSLDRMILAGWASDFVLAMRLTPAGLLDASFNGTGVSLIGFVDFVVYSVASDSLDRVVLAGDWWNGQATDFGVVRLTTQGTLDATFSGTGYSLIDFGAFRDQARGVTVDSLNRIVVAGLSLDYSLVTMAAARLTSTGLLDSSFGNGGKITFGFGSSVAAAIGVALDAAGRPIVAGRTETYGSQFAIARLTGDTTTAIAQVNDGSAQRSMVTSLTVTFSSPVTFAGPVKDAFTLIRDGGKSVTFTATTSVVNGATVVTLSNFSGNETQFGSLRDGRYTLTALASQISAGGQPLDGDANGTPGGNFVFGDSDGLFRFFGDINGDRQVDGADFSAFSFTYGSFASQSNYLWFLDINGDGQIDGVEFSQFSGRFNTMLP